MAAAAAAAAGGSTGLVGVVEIVVEVGLAVVVVVVVVVDEGRKGGIGVPGPGLDRAGGQGTGRRIAGGGGCTSVVGLDLLPFGLVVVGIGGWAGGL